MLITTLLLHTIACDRWGWPLLAGAGADRALLVVDLAFFSANLIKIQEGGWFPILVGIGVYMLMTTWNRGRARLQAIVRENTLQMDLFLADVARRQAAPGARHGGLPHLGHRAGAPPVLLHHLKHNKVLHEKVILMSVVTEEIPAVDEEDRVECEELGEGFFQVIAHYGFMESPDIPSALAQLGEAGLATAARWRSRRSRPASSSAARRSSPPGTRRPRHAGRRTRSAGCRMLAEAALHPDDPERPLGHGVLRPPAEPRGGAGRADSVLMPSSPAIPAHRFVLCGRISRSAPQGVALAG